MAKIVETIIQTNLHEYLIRKNIITVDESAFFKRHSTAHASILFLMTGTKPLIIVKKSWRLFSVSIQ